MKKLVLFVLISALILSIASFSVSAEIATDTTINVSYEYNSDNGNITIIGKFTDIKPEGGIVALEYDVKYDHTVLELVKTEPLYPERWSDLIKNESIEDLSRAMGNGNYRWAFAVIPLGKGAKSSDEVGIKLEFKPIKQQSTNIRLEYVDLVTEIVENGKTMDFIHISGNSVSVDVSVDDPENPDIEKSDVLVGEDSSSESDTDVSGDVENTSPTSDDSEYNSESDIISMPSIDISDYVNDTAISNDNPDDSTGAENKWLIWVLSAVGVACVAAVGVFVFVRSKRGNK